MVEAMWEQGRIGPNPPTSASWGDSCKDALPREKIVSPYPYKTAKSHYEALLAAAKAHGGPTTYTKVTVPDWDGYYRARPRRHRHPRRILPSRPAHGGPGAGERWIWGGITQASTMLSLLTPEYQKRFVQAMYHEVVDNSKQWNASFCYPEGFGRLWAAASQASNFELAVTPYKVTSMGGVADNFYRDIHIGAEHVQKVPQWYGETIGFWDKDTLVTWTANIQAWTQHSAFEWSGKLETVETFKPYYDKDHKFIGIDHEAIWYDPEAQLQPVKLTERYLRVALPSEPPRPLHLHRVPVQHPQRQRPPAAADQGQPDVRGLLRPPLGPELGAVAGEGLGQARRRRRRARRRAGRFQVRAGRGHARRACPLKPSLCRPHCGARACSPG